MIGHRLTRLVLALAAGLCFSGTAAAQPPPIDTVEAQLDFLAGHRQDWETLPAQEDTPFARVVHFAVTDLDNNGRLEILFSAAIGQQPVAENWGYEVNEAGDGLVPLLFRNGADHTPISRPSAPLYFACQRGTYHYVFQEDRRYDWSEHGGELSGLSLAQGEIYRTLLGRFSEARDPSGQAPPVRQYFDDKDRSISAAAYSALARRHYDYYHPGELTLGWVPMARLDEAMKDQKQVRALLAGSWAGFCIRISNEEVH